MGLNPLRVGREAQNGFMNRVVQSVSPAECNGKADGCGDCQA